ncbi:helix-turn-helix domain-containing protein [Pedobacter sp. AW31-3R]|uniref:helix-turn-helix domain-containing protein n=1 Tax=Pedobacter sp. AW31-3R TaxID=3445781 RepID=UPI003FA0C705
MINHTSLEDFYKRNSVALPDRIAREIGHFNIFETEKLFNKSDHTRVMPYSRRAYYKISWLRGTSRVEYADKVIDVKGNALLFATPRIPYNWVPENSDQTGMFCIFTADFFWSAKSGVLLDELPVFQPRYTPVFELSDEEVTEIEYIFRKMHKEMESDYKFKYDLLRTLVMELIHYGQKLQPILAISQTQNASERISSLFVELLERQFPLDSIHQRLMLRSAKDYADRLAVHVNHLNKVLKEATGTTTKQIINHRICQEAKIMLKHTDWNVQEIAYVLGFDDAAQFSNFFKKQTSFSPSSFRLEAVD